MKYDVVVVAAGKGIRSGLNYNKAFFVMDNNKTLLENSCKLFIEDEDCQKVIVVTSEEYLDKVFKHNKVITCLGGSLRKDSVYNGLKNVTSEYVLIHDGARPNLNINALNKLKDVLVSKGNVILAHQAIDTVKEVVNEKIVKTLDRKNIYLAETPQGFKTEFIKYCYEHCENIEFTDDASLVESLGYDVYIVNDEYNNKKFTYKEDFE
ncbi:MAG: IspD/TarI family cytidylyltransferase [Erysipelotrichaceae bacterium]|nr:IspD/TarI family cytidylyltransferase [Erysipelotrichaceae bacterium]